MMAKKMDHEWNKWDAKKVPIDRIMKGEQLFRVFVENKFI